MGIAWGPTGVRMSIVHQYGSVEFSVVTLILILILRAWFAPFGAGGAVLPKPTPKTRDSRPYTTLRSRQQVHMTGLRRKAWTVT